MRKTKNGIQSNTQSMYLFQSGYFNIMSFYFDEESTTVYPRLDQVPKCDTVS